MRICFGSWRRNPAARVQENEEDFYKFIDDVRQKWVNALSLSIAIRLGRHGEASEKLPESMKLLDLAIAAIRFILVVKNHREDWLPPLQDALNKALKPTAKTWALSPSPVAVMNEDIAKLHGLIVENPDTKLSQANG